MPVLRATLVLALLGCFNPVETEGTLHCGSDGSCPSGFECGEGDLCWRDGRAPDAPPPPPQCSNGIDDDCDGLIDNNDPGCMNGDDNDERGTKRCDDGLDNDNDGFVDFRLPECLPPGAPPPDPGCDKPDDDSE